MPSTSDKQRRFMAAAANNPKFARKAGIKQSVAKDFHSADKSGYKQGGLAATAKNYFSHTPNSSAPLIQRPGAMMNQMMQRPPQGGGLAQANKPQQPRFRPRPGGMPMGGGRGGMGRMPPQGMPPGKFPPGGGRMVPPSMPPMGGDPRGMPPRGPYGPSMPQMPPQPGGGFPSPGGMPPGMMQTQGGPNPMLMNQMQQAQGQVGQAQGQPSQGGLQQMMQQFQQQQGQMGAPGGPSAGMPPQRGFPGMSPGGGGGMPLRGAQRPGGAFRGAPGRLPPGIPQKGPYGGPQAGSADMGARLQQMRQGLGGRRQFAGGGAAKAALKKHRLLVDGKIINPGDVVRSSDGEEFIFHSVSRQNEQLTGGNSGGKIIVEAIDDVRTREALKKFWATYLDEPSEAIDANAQYLEDNLSDENWAIAHEAWEEGDERVMENLLYEFEGHTREYYPTVVGGKVGPPPIERIKQRGGRIRRAGGGAVKKVVSKARALAALKNAREMLEDSDPDIDHIARLMMKDPDLKPLGRRVLANEKRVGDMDIEQAEKYYERISRLLDEAEAKLKD